MNTYIFIAILILAVIQLAIFRIQDKKQRYIALSVFGVALMISILIATILTKMWPATIWMGLLLCTYCLCLIWVWNRFVKKS